MPALFLSPMTEADSGYRQPSDAETPVRCELANPVDVIGAGVSAADSVLSRAISQQQVRLAAVPSAVPWARRVVHRVLGEWALEEIADPALLLVSELVTNAVQASGGCSCEDGRRHEIIVLLVALTESGLLLQVWDSSPVPPVLQEPDITSDRGRGLVLVDVLAQAWGHNLAGGGKVVWCELGGG